MACHAFQQSYCCCLTTSAQLPWFRLKKMAKVQAFGYWATLHLMRCCHPITVWCGSVTKQNRNRLQCTLSSAEMFLSLHPGPLQIQAVRNRAAPPAADPSRKLLGLLPTGRYYKALLAKTTRFKLVPSPRWVSKISPTCTSCTLMQHCTFKCLCKYVHTFIYFHCLSFPLYVQDRKTSDKLQPGVFQVCNKIGCRL